VGCTSRSARFLQPRQFGRVQLANPARMSPDDLNALSDRVRRLLRGPLDSFEKLEIVLALRARGSDPVLPDALESLVGTPMHVLGAALDELVAEGIVERRADGAAGISPASDPVALEELADAWSNARAAVLGAMTARAVERIRASAARAFADAFKLGDGRKDRGGDDG
ncbi:MAG: hypothetical protein ACREI7_08565, partial [Myxococcota bacterium]